MLKRYLVFFLIGIFLISLTSAQSECPKPSDFFGWAFCSISNLWENWFGGEVVSAQATTINYKNKNMTVDFILDGKDMGEATLKSHKTYDEILKVTSGKDKAVVYYEFNNFKDNQKDAFGEVEFIDMREMIENKTYTESFKGDIEKMDEFKVLIKNPDYLKPIEKNYTFVYLDEKGNWLTYNSKDIPKRNITIGVQTDLFWGEFLDVRFNILGNKLDRHAIVLGTSSGFVTTAPTDDPEGSGSTIDDRASVTKDTSPSTAVKITEIGWWCDTATEESNFEVGLYAANGTIVPGEAGTLLQVSRTNAKGTTAGWKRVTVNWAISSSTAYWLGVQLDDTATTTRIDTIFPGGVGYDAKSSQATLANPFGGGVLVSAEGMAAVYAVWEASVVDTTPPTYSLNQTNSTVAGGSTLFSILWNDDTALHPTGQYIFSTNNSGVWVNDSAVNFTTTPSWANVTKTLNSTVGLSVGFRWYADDNAGNVNNTGVFSLVTTTADTCTYTSGNWAMNCSDSCNISTNVNLNKNNISIIGAGTVTLTANITNWTQRLFQGIDSNSRCIIQGIGGWFQS